MMGIIVIIMSVRVSVVYCAVVMGSCRWGRSVTMVIVMITMIVLLFVSWWCVETVSCMRGWKSVMMVIFRMPMGVFLSVSWWCVVMGSCRSGKSAMMGTRVITMVA